MRVLLKSRNRANCRQSILGDLSSGRALTFSTRHMGVRTVDEGLPLLAQTMTDALHAWRAARKDRLWIRVNEATELLGIGETSLRNLMRSHRIAHRRAGGSSLIFLDSAIDYAIREIQATYIGVLPTDRRGEALARGRATQQRKKTSRKR